MIALIVVFCYISNVVSVISSQDCADLPRVARNHPEINLRKYKRSLDSPKFADQEIRPAFIGFVYSLGEQ